jgi:hypothetical protein
VEGQWFLAKKKLVSLSEQVYTKRHSYRDIQQQKIAGIG